MARCLTQVRNARQPDIIAGFLSDPAPAFGGPNDVLCELNPLSLSLTQWG
jgi:hypothetical protein